MASSASCSVKPMRRDTSSNAGSPDRSEFPDRPDRVAQKVKILERQRLVKAQRVPQLLDIGLAGRRPCQQDRDRIAGQVQQAPDDGAHRPEREHGEQQPAADVPPHSHGSYAGTVRSRGGYPAMVAYCRSIRSKGLGVHWSFLFTP